MMDEGMIFVNKRKKMAAAVVCGIFILIAAVIFYNYDRNKSAHNSKQDSSIKQDSAQKSEKNIVNDKSSVYEKDKAKIKESSAKNTLTKNRAIEITEEYVKKQIPNSKFVFDHEETKGDKNYYVVHAFDSMEDHGATTGWYYIDKSTGKLYEYDVAEDKLLPIK